MKVPGSVTKEPPGVRVHRTSKPAAPGKLRGVPVTSPSTTIFDLAGLLPEAELDTVLQQAVVGGSVRLETLLARLPEARGCRGTAGLRNLLESSGRRPHVVTHLEQAVADALSGAGLPATVREHPVYAGGRVYYLDFAWPSHRVAIEADGRRWHSDSRSFEQDRVRQNALAAAGWRVLRVTDRQIRSHPGRVCEEVAELVGMSPGIRR